MRLSDDDKILRALQALKDQSAPEHAPSRVEAAVLDAFRAHKLEARRTRFRWSYIAAMAASLLIGFIAYSNRTAAPPIMTKAPPIVNPPVKPQPPATLVQQASTQQ